MDGPFKEGLIVYDEPDGDGPLPRRDNLKADAKGQSQKPARPAVRPRAMLVVTQAFFQLAARTLQLCLDWHPRHGEL